MKYQSNIHFKNYLVAYIGFAVMLMAPAVHVYAGSLTEQKMGIYVINSLAETVSYIDSNSNTITNNIALTGKWPNWIGNNNNLSYIVNSGDNNIHVIRMSDFAVVGKIDTGVNTNPYAMAFSDNNKAYVACFISNELLEIDLNLRIVNKRISVGRGPEGVAVFGNKAYVTNTAYAQNNFGEGTVTVVDIETGSVIKTIPVHTNPQTVFVDNRGRINVLCTGKYRRFNPPPYTGNGIIDIIDPVSDTVVNSLALGGNPFCYAQSNAGIVYICGWWGGIMAYDTADDTILNDETNPILNDEGFMDMVFCNTTNLLYIAKFDTDEVIVFDTVQQEIIRVYQAGDGTQALMLYNNAVSIQPLEHASDMRMGPNPWVISSESQQNLRIENLQEQSIIEIYDISGQRIKILHAGNQQEILWDGKQDDGTIIEGGIYVCRIYNPTDSAYGDTIIKLAVIK